MGQRSDSHGGTAGRIVAAAILALTLLAGCGGGGATEVEAGQGGPEPGAPVAPGPGAGPTSVPAPTTATPDAPPPTTIVVAPDGEPGASPVAGLDAAAVSEAVTASPPGRARGVAGPVAETVALSDGAIVWRVRIPGAFPARDARATVTVGGRVLGVAASPPGGDALIAVTTTAEGLVAGAEVAYRWGGDEPIVAGPLVVVG